MIEELVVSNASIEEWVEKYLRKRHPELETDYRNTLAAFRRAMNGRILSTSDLKIIVDSVSSPYGVLWDNASSFLATLSRRYEAAREAIDQLSRARAPKTRFAALCSIGVRSDRELARRVILPLINDTTANVRWKAAEKAQRLQLTEAIPILEARRRVEKSARVRGTLEYVLPLLRDGYKLSREQGGFCLTVSGLGGTRSGHIKQSAVDQRGIKAIVAEWRKELDSSALFVQVTTSETD
jgi:HEAT repeats